MSSSVNFIIIFNYKFIIYIIKIHRNLIQISAVVMLEINLGIDWKIFLEY